VTGLHDGEGHVRVGIIGAGRLGGTLARELGRHGHEVVVTATRGRDVLATEVEGWSNVRAGERGDIAGCEVVILAFPWRSAAEALTGLDFDGRVVVDATNPFSEDFDVVDTGELGSTGAIGTHLPGARLVKAFNTLPAELLAEDAQETAPTVERTGLPVAADDVDARDEVVDLIGDLGFTAVPVGGLDAGRDLMEPQSPLFNVPLPAGELAERVRQLRA
jgi:8-hydroxy-5-deazaflavin:NADPH oxidoreductase